MLAKLSCLAVTLLLSGCPASVVSNRERTVEAGSEVARPPPSSSGSPDALPTPQTTPPPVSQSPQPRENHLSAATRSLVTQSRSQASHGDFDGASSTLDRALRIEPNNPLLWVEMGRLRLSENDAHQGEVCGRRALALASGDRATQAQAGRLLADALRAQQRNQEAVETERQPFMR